MRIVNLTGHDLRLGHSAELLASEGKARAHGELRQVTVVHIDGPPAADIPILEVTERSLRGLPGPREGVLYVVSGIVAAAAMREDVVAPGRVERAGNGRVTACHAFVRPRTMNDS